MANLANKEGIQTRGPRLTVREGEAVGWRS